MGEKEARGAERRRFSRSSTRFLADLVTEDGVPHEASTQNVSLKGARLECVDALEPGQWCRLVISLADPDGEPRIEAEATVVWRREGHVGVEITKIDELSLVHLRRLVTYNSDDPDHVDEEFRLFLRLTSGPHGV